MRRWPAALLLCALTATTVRAQTSVLVIAGLGGEPRYSKSFHELSLSLTSALHERFGIPEADITWLGEDSVSKAPHYGGSATKANIDRVVQGIVAKAKPGGQVVFVLIGHGAGEGPESRISIPGPDITATDFAAIFARLPGQRIAFLNLTSASGDMVATLSGPNRVIITATKTALERNESRFAQFFVDALAKDGADTDKDGRVSLLEAFRYAARETKRAYENETKLMTEHAQLDDDGDRQATAEPTGRLGDGLLARRFFLDIGKFTARVAANDPRLGPLYAERFSLEEQIDVLKQKKPAMTAVAYDDELEKLLVALARKSREIRSLEGRS